MARKCFDELKKAFGEKFDEKQAEGILNDMEFIEKMAETATDLRSFRKLMLDYYKDRQVLTRSQLKQKVANKLKTKQRNDYYIQQENKGIPIAKAIKSKLSRFGFQGEGAGMNVESLFNSLNHQYVGMVYNSLRKEGKDVVDAFREMRSNDEISLAFAMELEQLHLKNGATGISNNSTALKIAKSVYAAQNQMLKDMQAADIDIGKLDGRFIRNTHDPEKILSTSIDRDEAFSQWKKTILSKLDKEKTFGLQHMDEKYIEEYLQGAFDDIVNYKNEIADGHGISDELIMVNKKSANQAERAARHRKLHFKSAKDWFEYNKIYGKDTVVDGIIGEFQRNARTTALVSIFGSNPEAALEADIKRARQYLRRKGDAKALADFDAEVNSSHGGVMSLYGTLTGVNEAGFDSPLAKRSAFLRNMQNILKLGLATIGSLPDIGNASTLISAKTGKNFFQAHLDIVSGIFDASKTNRAQAAADFGLAVDDMIGDVLMKFQLDPDVPGRMSDLTRKYFKMIGLSQWTNRVKTASVMAFSRELAQAADRGMNDLNPRLKSWMKRYNITAEDWDVMRNSIETDGSNKQISIASVIKNGGSPELRFKMSALFNDVSNLGSPTPSARVKNLIVGQTRSDDYHGQIYRFMGQFKSFPLTMYDIGFSIANSDPSREITKFSQIFKGRGDIQHMIGLAVSLTTLGYLSNVARAVAQGKTPPDPKDKGVWLDAMLRGGAAGILGDLYFSESRKYDGSIFDDVAGPVLGEFKKLFILSQELIQDDIPKLLDGEETKIGKKIFKAIERNTNPNIPFIKPTIEYLFMNSIHEALNPGYLKNREKRLKEQGQEFFIPQFNEEAF